MVRAVFLLSLLTIGCAQDEDLYINRRYLAQMLIDKEYLSPPQSEDCTLHIDILLIKYATLRVNMKELHIQSRLEADIQWMDPELAWNTSLYPYGRVIMPANKIWTPEIAVENGKSSMAHDSNDLLVYSNGTVSHKVTVMAEVKCEINLFNYPFAYDVCPVALTSTPPGECGIVIDVGQVQLAETSHGDWETEEVKLEKLGEGRSYIDVHLRIRYSNPFITLLLPTLLIMLADIFSSALPLQTGERNSFKVTLVLSFTLFLNILTDVLPGDSKCSPVIRIHFCICQVLMVISMLVSIVLTRVAEDGFDFFSCFCKTSANQNVRDNEENKDAEAKGEISVIQRDASEDSQRLQKMVRFLEAYNTKQAESERYQTIADKLDKIFFWGYFIVNVVYFTAMFSIMVRYECKVNHLYFWA